MKVLIICGGKGERLKSVSGDLPKPLVKVGEKSILEHQFDLLARHGLTDITLCLGYRAETFKEDLGDGSKYGVSLTYSVEPMPLGTAGAVKLIKDLPEKFMVIYGDLVADFDIQRMLAFSARHQNTVLLQRLVRDNCHAIEIDSGSRITKIHPKNTVTDKSKYYNNGAIYVLSKFVMDQVPLSTPSDFANDVFPRLLAEGVPLHGYFTEEYIEDMGAPDWYHNVFEAYKKGRFGASKPAVFLDRDGVINHLSDKEVITSVDQLRIVDGAAEAIKLLNTRYPVVIVSNQGAAVASGLISEKEAQRINDHLIDALRKQGAVIDAVYYCPHYPLNHPRLKVRQFAKDCECRKPKPGMMRKAAEEMRIDLERSFVIGDSTSDINAGRSAGCTTILVNTGYAGKDGGKCAPDHVEKDILSAAKRIVSTRDAGVGA